MASAPVMRLAFPQGDEGLERVAPQHHDRLLAVSETDARAGQVEPRAWRSSSRLDAQPEPPCPQGHNDLERRNREPPEVGKQATSVVDLYSGGADYRRIFRQARRKSGGTSGRIAAGGERRVIAAKRNTSASPSANPAGRRPHDQRCQDNPDARRPCPRACARTAGRRQRGPLWLARSSGACTAATSSGFSAT